MTPTNTNTNPPEADRRRRSYEAGGRIARERLRRQDAAAADALDRVRAEDIVVVRGAYDHVEQVLGALELPFVTVGPDDVARLPLRPEQLLVVNCPGEVGPAAIDHIRAFVAGGGSLFTTDWALRHVLEPAFPGLVAFSGTATADDVVRLDAPNLDNPFLAGVVEGADDPLWWLEGSSYPIRVLDPARVQVLLSSREMGERYGEAAIAVQFAHGQGEVFHMVSHYYLQRTELRSARHAAPAASYLAEKGIDDPELVRLAQGLSVGDVESAATSARLFANMVSSKRRLFEAPDPGPAPTGAAAGRTRPVELFVYGTLMPGHARFAAVEGYVEASHRSSIRGVLVDTGNGYPALDLTGAGEVHGWVLRLKAGVEDEALAALDAIEGPGFERTETRTLRGRRVVTYRWRTPAAGLPVIADGRWTGA